MLRFNPAAIVDTAPGFRRMFRAGRLVFLARVVGHLVDIVVLRRGDAGSAHRLGTPAPMIGALARLGGVQPGGLPQSLRAFGVTDMPAWTSPLASHRPIEARSAARRGSRPAAMMAR